MLNYPDPLFHTLLSLSVDLTFCPGTKLYDLYNFRVPGAKPDRISFDLKFIFVQADMVQKEAVTLLGRDRRYSYRS